VNIGDTTGGFYRQFNETLSTNLDPLAPGMNATEWRDSVANTLFHEAAHGLSKSGRILAPYMNQIDPKATLAWANELVKSGQLTEKDVEYWSDPYEVMARGVAGKLQLAMNPKANVATSTYETNKRQAWPPEYDELMSNLAQGVMTGKMPIATKNIGFMETLSRMATDVRTGRLPQALVGFATGGVIPGSSNEDTVPAMLTPGEFVVNRHTVGMFGPQFFHALQEMAKMRGVASPESVLAGTHGALKFASGGTVPKLPKVSSQVTEQKITVANVMDEESVGQFLNTKKYGEVLVNKLGSGVTRRMMGGQGI